MKLREYVEIYPRGKRSAVVKSMADACGVTPGAIRHYINGIRNVPAKHVLPLSQATNGAVSVEELLASTEGTAA